MITITGRNTEVPDHFEEKIREGVEKAIRLDDSIAGVTVILQKEKNPSRDSESCKVEITAQGYNHVARSEAKEENFYASLDTALSQLERSLRKVKVRREITKSGHRTPLSIREVVDILAQESKGDQEEVDKWNDYADEYKPGQVVKKKVHSGKPMTVDEALSNMELVGHDFYLFMDSEDNRPTLVYRRHAFDYGQVKLDV